MPISPKSEVGFGDRRQQGCWRFAIFIILGWRIVSLSLVVAVGDLVAWDESRRLVIVLFVFLHFLPLCPFQVWNPSGEWRWSRDPLPESLGLLPISVDPGCEWWLVPPFLQLPTVPPIGVHGPKDGQFRLFVNSVVGTLSPLALVSPIGQDRQREVVVGIGCFRCRHIPISGSGSGPLPEEIEPLGGLPPNGPGLMAFIPMSAGATDYPEIGLSSQPT